jgi:hypothetical protein
MLFLRVFQHLLPDALAWRLTTQKTLRRFFEGLAGTPADARAFVDEVYEDLFPETTRELAEWERQFGIEPNPSEAVRRQNLAAEWAATGGQSPHYIQSVLRTAGFDVYIHEWWSSGPPYIARDPRDYTKLPLVGSTQCGESRARCGESSARCSRFLQNDPRYLVNENLTHEAPPPIPDDPNRWRFFFYIGGQTFPEFAFVPAERRGELKRLILKIKPAQQWVVLLINFEAPVFTLITEAGDPITTEAGDNIIVSAEL